MSTTVRRILIDQWVSENGPDGLSRLALICSVSSSTLSKVRNGLVPKKAFTRKRIADALGVPETDLFPPAPTGKKKAS